MKAQLESLKRIAEALDGQKTEEFNEPQGVFLERIAEAVENGGGGSSGGGASFPTITLTASYDETSGQYTYSVADYGSFGNFDNLANSTVRETFVCIDDNENESTVLCTFARGGSAVYITSPPIAQFGGGTWHVNGEIFTVYNDGFVSNKTIEYSFNELG